MDGELTPITPEKKETVKTLETGEQRTNRPWLFKKGQSGNPSGRPKGKSMKEYAKEMLRRQTDEERQKFLAGLPKEVIWKMAEGAPDAKTDITSKGEKINTSPIIESLADKINELEKDALHQGTSEPSDGGTPNPLDKEVSS